MRVRMAKGRVRKDGMSIEMERWRIEMERWREVVWKQSLVGLSPPPCATARLPSSSAVLGPQGQEVLASWRRQHGSLVRFVDARVVSQSLYSLI